MDVLNNAKKIYELKKRMDRMEKENIINNNKNIAEDRELDSRVTDLKHRVEGIEASMVKIAEQNYNILKASNDNIKVIIDKFEEQRGNKEDQPLHCDREQLSKEGNKKRTREEAKQMENQEADKELAELKEAAGRMTELEIRAAEILRDIA